MRDRVPTPGQEGRVKITPESGGAAYYAKLEMADNPTQAGDEPIKANLLPDDVAAALGLTGNPQVKDALLVINTIANSKAKIETFSYTGTGTYGVSNPMSFTFDGVPKMVVVTATIVPSIVYYGAYWLCGMLSASYAARLAALYESSNTIREGAVFSKLDEKTISWYSKGNADQQLNYPGVQYTIWALY